MGKDIVLTKDGVDMVNLGRFNSFFNEGDLWEFDEEGYPLEVLNADEITKNYSDYDPDVSILREELIALVMIPKTSEDIDHIIDQIHNILETYESYAMKEARREMLKTFLDEGFSLKISY